jgi:squalene-associated FAD-dependent desaturase
MSIPRQTPSLAIVGGGLAGLAAAVAAVEQGFRVELFEARRRLGGRAGSFRDPQSEEWFDNCQHVALGCCTNLADFCRRTGIADGFRRDRQLRFVDLEGRHHEFSASRWLPAPLHLVPGLMRLRFLSRGERWHILQTMGRLVRLRPSGDGEDRTVEDWLRQQGESQKAIQQFWAVVLVSALGDVLDRVSLAAARKVFVDGFLTSRRAYELEIPQAPLTEIYDRRLSQWLASRGVSLHLGTRIRAVEGGPPGAEAVVLSDGSRRAFDFVVVAVPWHQIGGLFSEAMFQTLPGLRHVDQIEPSPISSVHFWFDRPLHPWPHAVLVGRLSQWIFRVHESSAESCYQVVISGSRALRGRAREEVVAQVREELSAAWPEARDAQLLRWRVVTEPRAVFSVQPGLERYRPSQQTAIPNLALAGDWTATGWPATMEGAVRSGYLAMEAILRVMGRARSLLAPDLPLSAMARWLLAPRPSIPT